MADVKWIKLCVDMFDNRKIRYLRRLPEGNNIVLIWVMLLTMAGRCNAGGMIFLTENVPYTTKMLADELDFEESTVQLAISALVKLGMVSTDETGLMSITGWEEHQNEEGLAKIREQGRLRAQKFRDSKKLTSGVTENNVTNNVTVTQSNATEGERRIKNQEKRIQNTDSEDVGTAGNLPAVLTITLNDKSEYPIYEKDVAEWQELYPAVDIMQELRNMRGWCNANPTRRKTSRGVRAFINHWLSGEQDKGGNRNATQTVNDQRNGQYMSAIDRRNSQFEQEGEISDMGLQDIQSLVARGNAYDPE